MVEQFSKIIKLEYLSKGLVELKVSVRKEGEERNFKIVNNLTGLFLRSKPSKMLEIARVLNNLLPEPSDGELILGFLAGGVIPAFSLASVRDAQFAIASQKKVGDYQKAITFEQPNKKDSTFYVYDYDNVKSAILIDDEASTGDSLINAASALRKAGIRVGVICVVTETVNFGAREKIKEALDIDLISLVRIKLE